MAKIILCTTFRDFLGTENDKIQYRFLDTIKNQSYQNFKVVTTTFGEKNVRKVVDEYFGNKSVVIDVKLEKYRFSLTDVVINAINESENEEGDCIIFWTCCDNILKEDFFEKLSLNYTSMCAGVIHPNYKYANYDDFINNGIGHFYYLSEGVDSLFFDAKLLQKAKGDILNYRFYEWGIFEYFLMAVIFKFAKSKINLFPETYLGRIDNNRTITKKTEEYHRWCTDLNRPVFEKYLKDNRLKHVKGNIAFLIYDHFTPTRKTMKYVFNIHTVVLFGKFSYFVKRVKAYLLIRIKSFCTNYSVFSAQE